MKGYNVIVVFDRPGERVLMCRRQSAPYQGLINFVGGRIEPGEDGLTAAYRELREETGVTGQDVALTHFMDSAYLLDGYYLEIYVGQLNKEVTVFGTENPLLWLPLPQNFFDIHRFAGNGLLGHIMLHVYAAGERLGLNLKGELTE